MKTLDGKVVVITGAASGVGEGAARRFAEEGATLVLGDIDTGALDKLAGELGGIVETRETDVTDRAACEALVEAAIARGDGPSGFSLDATLMAPVIPSSRSSSSIGLPGW